MGGVLVLEVMPKIPKNNALDLCPDCHKLGKDVSLSA